MKLAKRAPLCTEHLQGLGAAIGREGLHLTDAQIRRASDRLAERIPGALAEKGYRLRRWECPLCDMVRIHDESNCANPDCPGVDMVPRFLDDLARGLADGLRRVLGSADSREDRG